jgi:hypothetical protein
MNKSKSNIILYIFCIGIIFIFFLFNVYTPLIADDYSYSLGINSILDIVKSQYEHYFNWGGRSIAHFLAQLWLLIGKPLFNVANTMIYCLFIILVYFHITGTFKKFNPILFIIINITFWIITPAWGQNFLWLTGSCNYLWTSTIILLFIVPFRIHLENNKWKLSILLSIIYLFIGVFAGWSNENSGAALLFFFIGYFIIKKINHDIFCLFEILSFIGLLIGFILLIIAPGNYVRTEVINEMNPRNHPMIIINLINRFFDISKMFFNYGTLFMFIIILIAFDIIGIKKILQFSILGFNFSFNYQRQNKLKLFTYIYVLAAFIGAYSMVLSPTFPPRAYFIIIVFSIISFYQIFLQREYIFPKLNKITKILFLLLLIFIIFSSLINRTRRIIGVYIRWYERIEYINSEMSKNNFDLEVPLIPSRNKYNALYGLIDLNGDENKNKKPNTSIARFFDLNSISCNEILHEELSLRKNLRKILFPVWLFRYP